MNAQLKRLFFASANEWAVQEPLLRWGRGGPDWTVGLSFEGSLNLGGSGSGKTSAGVCSQTEAVLRAGYGALCLSAKGSDTEMFMSLARRAGRERSTVVVGPSHGLGFNVLRYELTAASRKGSIGDMASNVATLFGTAADLAMPRRNGGKGEHIWRQAVESLVRHAVTVVFGATGDLRLDDLVAVVQSAPQSTAQLKDPAWCRDSRCMRMLERALQRLASDRNLALARSYFLTEFPGYPSETKNSVLFSFGASSADLFQRDPLHAMFFAGTDYTPEILLDGAVIILDCPVLEFREVGQLANGLLRLCAQRVLERRGSHSSRRPVAIIWDESQKTLLRSDVAFQETARSSLCATVAATQHVPALRDAVGIDLAANFLGNLRSKIFWQNNESETGDFMRKLCGQHEVRRRTTNRGHDGHTGSSETPVWEDALPAQATHNLKTGGKVNGYWVTGFLVVGSRRIHRGEPYRKILVHQKRLSRPWWPFSKRAYVVALRRPAPDFRYLRRERS